MAVVVLFHGKLGPKNVNPLTSLDQNQWGRIVAENPPHSVTFIQTESEWKVSEPVKDIVDPGNMDQLLSKLVSFSVGSIVSENKDRYSRFELEEGKAKRLRVFKKGEADPLFDGYFGKRAMGYGTSYFRFQGEDPVRLVSDFPIYLLQRPVNDYRKKRIFPQNVDDLQKIQFEMKKDSISLQKSSQTWNNEKTGEPLDTKWMGDLKAKLRSLVVTEFGSGEDKEKDFGFSNPLLKIHFEGPDHDGGVLIGSELAPPEGEKIEKRYAKMENREAILILRVKTVDDLIDQLEKGKK